VAPPSTIQRLNRGAIEVRRLQPAPWMLVSQAQFPAGRSSDLQAAMPIGRLLYSPAVRRASMPERAHDGNAWSRLRCFPRPAMPSRPGIESDGFAAEGMRVPKNFKTDGDRRSTRYAAESGSVWDSMAYGTTRTW